MEVICLNKNGEELALPLKEMLPYGYDNSFLPKE